MALFHKRSLALLNTLILFSSFAFFLFTFLTFFFSSFDSSSWWSLSAACMHDDVYDKNDDVRQKNIHEVKSCLRRSWQKMMSTVHMIHMSQDFPTRTNEIFTNFPSTSWIQLLKVSAFRFSEFSGLWKT